MARPSPSISSKQPRSDSSRTPEPPFPYHLRSEIKATQGMQYNAVIKMTVTHGKVVNAWPSGGNAELSNYLADWVRQKWVFPAKMNGTLTLPIKFRYAENSRKDAETQR